MKFISLKVGLRKDRYLYFDPHMTFMLFLLMLIMMIGVALIKESVMNSYFFSDQLTIFSFMKYTYGFAMGNSYGSTAYFYKLLGFEQSSIVFALISSLILISVYTFIFVKVKGGTLNLIDLSVFLFFCFSSMINLTWQSKDFIVFLMIMPLLLTFYSRIGGLIIWTLFALFYAYYFRTYWFLFLIEFYGLLFMTRFISHAKWIFVMCILSLLVLAIGFQYGLGIDVDSFRTAVNEHRLERTGDGSNTLITPWVGSGNPIFGWINVTITWVTFYFPFPLILLLSPYYVLISFFIIIMFHRIWKTLHNALQTRGNPILIIFSLIIISFTVVQSIFEPDYGSYLRHLAPFYPLMFYVYLNFGKFKKED
ncbi:hypothetical protein [Winslowiella iniecta]|uniref:Uncharacterized protein n=1 Tax=Winslowiella iniecta TaxID=1560201 RepID=A0A0L7T1A9_9GAMM|nr:hypothetical protein [Winslowiella iniecta]KOC89224.1 hypothetical protein NG43_19120 [Winslowiella iniecta]KOC92146.1 hypothetical protein NG42_02775 [Winslowiella iniecta]